MKISVLVTCYNLARFVEEAVASAQAQRPGAYEAEIIVVDDCSTDESLALLRNMSGIEIVASPTNRGVLLATLLGLSRCTGDVVCFLDGDDRWHPDKLACVAARFAEDPRLTLLSHDYDYIDVEGRRLPALDDTQRSFDRAEDADAQHELMFHRLLEGSGDVWLGSAWSIRRDPALLEAFARRCELLPEPRHTYQDWPLATFCATAPDARFGYERRKLFDYRLHGANHSGAGLSGEKVRSNLRKTLNTRRAMLELVQERLPRPDLVDAAKLRLEEAEYLTSVYAGERGAALRRWTRLTRELWAPRAAAKEALRWAGTAALGPDRATQILARVRGLTRRNAR